MGVVHNGVEASIGVGVGLHPPGHPGTDQAVVYGGGWDMEGMTHRDDPQGIFYVEQPWHGQAELPLILGGADVKDGLSVLLPDLAGIDVRLWVPLGEGEHGPACLPGGLQDPVGVITVQIDAVHPGLGEDLQLGGEVVLKIRVLHRGDVVIANVEEAGGGKAGTQGTVIFQSLAGHLHGEVLQPRVGGVGQVALEVQRLWGGEMGLEALHPVIGVDRGDDTSLPSPLPAPPGIQNGFQVVGGGRLPFGPREANHLQPPRGMAVAQVGQQGHGPAQIGEPQAGEGTVRIECLAGVEEGPPFPGGLQIFLPKMGALTEKQGPRDHVPGVAGDQGHRGAPVQAVRDGVSQKVLLLQQGQICAQWADEIRHTGSPPKGQVDLVDHLLWI